MKFKSILITVESPDFNLLNRYSAVSSVVYSFATMLSNKGHVISINGKLLTDISNTTNQPIIASKSASGKGLHRFFPKRMRELIKDILLFRKLKVFNEQLENSQQPDLIIAWITYGASFSADLAKKCNVPLISIYDNVIEEEYKYLFKFYPFFRGKISHAERKMVENASAIIVYSKAVEQHVRSKYKLSGNFYYKAFTDFKRMSFNSFNRNDENVNFAYIGSFFNWHKIEDLVNAFINLRKVGLKCKLTLIGDGPEFERINLLVKQSDFESDIEFTGRLDAEELENKLGKIHVGVIPNALWWQGPVKLFQYSAAKMPVICKSTPTIKELTKESEGYLFFDSMNELEQQMKFLVNSPAKIETLGKSTQQFALENFSEKAFEEFFENIFKEI